jgi:hypothetical protein
MEIKEIIFYLILFFGTAQLSAQETTDSKDIFDKIPIRITPKSVRDTLNITFQKEQPYKIVLYNGKGIILKTFITEHNTFIDMKNYENGNYVVEVIDQITENGFMQRVVKK